MRAVRTNGKLDLEQELISRRADRPVGEAILPAHLTELARPVREDARPPAVVELCVGGTVRSVETDAGEPASCKLILTRHVETRCVLDARRLFAPAPDHFGTADERVVDRTLERLPAHRRVDAEQPRREVVDARSEEHTSELQSLRHLV